MAKSFDGGWQKRPTEFTPERLLALRESGVTIPELLARTGISRTRLYDLFKQAKRTRATAAQTQS